MNYHEKWMEQAFLEAEKAYQKKEVPVGAVIVFEDKIIGRGHNLTETLQDPTAHAEMLAITAAANYLAHWRLEETSLYVTLEPCPMCVGAMIHARLARLVFAAADPKTGAAGGRFDLLGDPAHNHEVQVDGGCCARESSVMLKNFFRQRR